MNKDMKLTENKRIKLRKYFIRLLIVLIMNIFLKHFPYYCRRGYKPASVRIYGPITRAECKMISYQLFNTIGGQPNLNFFAAKSSIFERFTPNAVCVRCIKRLWDAQVQLIVDQLVE